MIRLLALLLGLTAASGAAPPGAPRLEPLSRAIWSEGMERFGGFSAIEMLDDGRSFVAISDRGHWARGALERDRKGEIERVRMTGFGPLLSVEGARLRGENDDAEGVAVAPDGAIYVSFEGYHRIRRYPDLEGPAETVKGHTDFRRLQFNSSLEALAIDAEGAIYTIPERSGQLTRPFPVYRLKDGVWDRRLSIPREGPFLVVGADFGPDGRLYVLERDFTWMGGFSNRVRSFRLGPDGFDDEATLLQTPFGSADNFEGITVWRDDAGGLRATLIADDNFFALQSTVIAEYLLVGGQVED
jgi:hypothetical protein